MTTPTTDTSNLQDELDAMNAQVTKQGSAVRQLKKDGAEPDVIAEAVQRLQDLKIQAAKLLQSYAKEDTFDRKAFDDLVLRKMFVIPSFEIHGGVKGLFDLGPPACALKVCTYCHACWLTSVTLYVISHI
jgi:glycyl-tRNA synthetase